MYIHVFVCVCFVRIWAQILLNCEFYKFWLSFFIKNLPQKILCRVLPQPVRATMSFIAAPMIKRVYVGYGACAGTHVTTYTWIEYADHSLRTSTFYLYMSARGRWTFIRIYWIVLFHARYVFVPAFGVRYKCNVMEEI